MTHIINEKELIDQIHKMKYSYNRKNSRVKLKNSYMLMKCYEVLSLQHCRIYIEIYDYYNSLGENKYYKTIYNKDWNYKKKLFKKDLQKLCKINNIKCEDSFSKKQLIQKLIKLD